MLHPNQKAIVLFNPRARNGSAIAPKLGGLSADLVIARPEHPVQVGARQPVVVVGGDGTLQRTLDQIFVGNGPPPFAPRLAVVGGGTMNVMSRWCGFGGSTQANVDNVLRAHARGRLRYRRVQLLKISQGDEAHVGFIFGMGPMIRVVEAFERRPDKTKLGAALMLGKALGSVFLPSLFTELAPAVSPLTATIEQDGVALPFEQYGLFFASTTGEVFSGTSPFNESRSARTFQFAAYADSTHAISATFPLLARGWTPKSKKQLYINRTSERMVIRSSEKIFTLDGEIFSSSSAPLTIRTGPTVELAVNPDLIEGNARQQWTLISAQSAQA